LATINSVNLLDGADGFAATIGIIMSLAVGAMALYMERSVDAILAMALAGALCGFLRYNFPPAKAFLGDSGSMLIGFVLGALAIRCSFKQHTAYAFFAPIAILAIPFIDTAAALIRRRLTGRSIYTVDRGHLHHTLMKRGYSPIISLLWVATLCATTAVGGTLAMTQRKVQYALASIVIVVVVMVFGRIFGVAEFMLIYKRVSGVVMSFFSPSGRARRGIQQSAVQLQGNRDWQQIWQQLCDFADEHAINEMTLDLNVPWLHEAFHATRRRADAKRGPNHEWYAEIPLLVGGRLFGRIEILSARESRFSHYDIVENLLKIIRDIERALRDCSEYIHPDDLEAAVPLPIAPTEFPRPRRTRRVRQIK
jgi:UDP-GlcNAc:undecaprenyl-phosphate GlcNAc-1-phosphate transferase